MNTEDVSHILWYGGYVPYETMENLELVATFPKFTEYLDDDGAINCVGRMRVYMPAIQYCTYGAINGWLLGEAAGPLADAIATDTQDLVSTSGTYAPYVDVMRSNPVDESCLSEETLTVYPSVAAVVEAQLKWNAKRAKRTLKRAAIKRVPRR